MKGLMEKFQELKLRSKIVLVFVLSTLLISAVNLWMFTSINHSLSTLDSVYDSNTSLGAISDTLNDLQDSVLEYLTSKGSDTLEDYYRHVQDYRTYLEELNDQPSDDPRLLLEKNIRAISSSYLALAEDAVSAKRGQDIEHYKAAYEEATELYGYLSDSLESLNDLQFKLNSENYTILLQSLSTVEMLSLGLLIFSLILNFLLLFSFAGAITRPLTQLAQRADQVSQGKLDVELLPTAGKDEFSVVAKAFNQMVVSLNDNIRQIRQQMEGEKRMVEEKLLMETHLKEAELRSLQAQINPHFLYNTLNAGAQLAMMEGAEDTCLFIENLADFFRYNVKKIGELATLEEELRQVENYLYIINVRFSGEIHFSRTGLEELPDLTLPSLVLQPLVENAIEHGLREVDWEKHITIDVQKTPGGHTVTVADNGVGIRPEVAAEILAGRKVPSQGKGHSSVGMVNVLSRLRLFYGREDLMTICSDPEQGGTAVSIFLPGEEEDYV